MRRIAMAMLMVAGPLSGLAAPARAQIQPPPADIGARYIPAPWWMREPVIASLGSVRVDLPANRARFTVRFSAVERESTAAAAAATRKVASLDAALRATGADRVRLTTTLGTRPLYDQYRDKAGNLVDNERADRIDRYEVTATIEIEVRDIAALESTYNSVLAAQPTSIGTLFFTLEPDNRTRAALANEAIRDATRRARTAAEASGARLGQVKIIDPTARVCRTDVLAGWPSYSGGTRPTLVEAEQLGEGAPPPPPPPAPPPPPGSGQTAARVTLQPPVRSLDDEACVVFALL